MPRHTKHITCRCNPHCAKSAAALDTDFNRHCTIKNSCRFEVVRLLLLCCSKTSSASSARKLIILQYHQHQTIRELLDFLRVNNIFNVRCRYTHTTGNCFLRFLLHDQLRRRNFSGGYSKETEGDISLNQTPFHQFLLG